MRADYLTNQTCCRTDNVHSNAFVAFRESTISILKSTQSHPKVIPKISQSHPKTSQSQPKNIPKSTQSHPKVIPKSSQSHLKVITVIPKSSQSHSKVIPKSSQSHLKNHPKVPCNANTIRYLQIQRKVIPKSDVILKLSKSHPKVIESQPKASKIDSNAFQKSFQIYPKYIPRFVLNSTQSYSQDVPKLFQSH